MLLASIMVIMSVATTNIVYAAPNGATKVIAAAPGNNWPVAFMQYVDSCGNAIYYPGADEHPIYVHITIGIDNGVGIYFWGNGGNNITATFLHFSRDYLILIISSPLYN